MMPAILWCSLLLACLVGSDASSCSGKWANMPESTMCRYSRPSSSAKNCGVSEQDKKVILDTHNRLRAGVNPSSSDMLKMYWNDDLAVVAQQWASQCRSAHDTNDNRQIPDTGKDMFIGQNWASGGIFPDWRSAIEDGWYSEVKDFTYGSSWHSGVVGHYTQVVQGAANLVGCGHCDCPQGPLYMCNYYRGNSQDKGHPYASGPPACNGGLCDCGDLMCKNNGTMNAKTCTCDCPGKWTGRDCMEYDCPPKEEESEGCGVWFQPEGCEMYFNVPDECPYMCGLCKEGDSNGGGGGNGGCTDSDDMCPQWAEWGECDNNPNWMRSNCKRSCKTC